MAWFRHHFYCEGCDGTWFAEAWLKEAALAAEADCPFCRARDVFPYRSEDRTLIIEQEGAAFAVLAMRQHHQQRARLPAAAALCRARPGAGLSRRQARLNHSTGCVSGNTSTIFIVSASTSST